MTRARLAAAVVLAPLLQVVLAERLPVRPDLVLLVTVVAGLSRGPVAGAVAGFAAGLMTDLIPPALPPAGRTALVLCLTGYLCGLLRGLPAPAGIALGVAAGRIAFACAALLPGVWPAPAQHPLAAVPYDLLLSPLVWFLLARRRRDRHRIPLERITDATSLASSPARGAPDGGRAVRLAARPPVAGADPGRRALRTGRGRRPRAARRHPGRARAHR
ncbi:rod shape-determining protein MreD [Thermocatellispora tengchongensis]|uniref:Rod shape-determining protein MreD n=1 Tax=Thermocatellispora tengchongensis TaxID=1073253 RepID=A0A840PMQ9_9ACTN|nr:hypothetical protein [Thermocatellispora tengchongensis]MBB5139071.1 rod shape-determining protein MreD [Thermocatellispora tengchongensis]